MIRRAALLAVPAVLAVALALAGCSTTPDRRPESDGTVHIVASTNVYGDIAASVALDDADITSVSDDPSADPHEFQASPRVQLALANADIVIVNGGGYDDFMQTMLDAAGTSSATVLNAVDLSGLDASADGFNEHVWYDYDAMTNLVDALAGALGQVDADDSAQYVINREDVTAQLENLASTAAAAQADVNGAGALVTEPVPLYLLEAMGFENRTPAEFSEAIEEDTDVPPALLQQVLALVDGRDVAVLAYNEQTGGPQTDAVVEAAEAAGVPAVGVTETLPEGQHYIAWQTALQEQLLQTVGASG